MIAALEPLFERGYLVISDRTPLALKAMIQDLDQAGFQVMRDIIIGDGDAQLAPHDGDFWFHTDGGFLPTPPRWVIIQVLHAEGGGGLHVVDAKLLESISCEACFGTENNNIVASIMDIIDGQFCIRYRTDYMHPKHPYDMHILDKVHTCINELAAKSSVSLGELASGECLITDNWRILHRREAFIGRRCIRRIWLTAKKSS